MKLIPDTKVFLPAFHCALFCFAYPPCENISSSFSPGTQGGSCTALSSQHYSLHTLCWDLMVHFLCPDQVQLVNIALQFCKKSTCKIYLFVLRADSSSWNFLTQQASGDNRFKLQIIITKHFFLFKASMLNSWTLLTTCSKWYCSAPWWRTCM